VLGWDFHSPLASKTPPGTCATLLTITTSSAGFGASAIAYATTARTNAMTHTDSMLPLIATPPLPETYEPGMSHHHCLEYNAVSRS
jgi:hypothetical protein